MKTTILGTLLPTSFQPLPYFIEHVAAGFPSPAAGYVEASIDLNELCVEHPNATFLVRVGGDSMIDSGIYPDDLLIVDRSIEVMSGDIVVCMLNGDFTVKELRLEPSPCLIAHNTDYPDIPIGTEADFEVFGVVINIIRSIKRGRGGQNRSKY